MDLHPENPENKPKEQQAAQAKQAKDPPKPEDEAKEIDENFLRDFFFRLLSSLVLPLWRRIQSWILHAPWPVRIVALVVVGFLVFGGVHWKQVWEGIHDARGLPTAFSEEKVLPLSVDEKKEVNDAILVGEQKLSGFLSQMEAPSPSHNAWTISQATVAAHGDLPLDPHRIAETLQQMKTDPCKCWKHYETDPPLAHIVSTDWALLALGTLSQSIQDSDIELLLESQNVDGWWPPYSGYAQSEKANASTYSTAMAVEALQNALSRGVLDRNNTLKGKALDSVNRGANWLSTIESGARWKDFPYAKGDAWKEPLGLSGLVLHVLHRTAHSSPHMDQDWLDSLPSDRMKALDEDENGYLVAIDAKQNSVRDSVRHLRLPWTIIATRDAYPSGSLLQRLKAVNWMKSQALSFPEQARQIPVDWPFISAELLIALRYLRGDMVDDRAVI